MDDKRNLFKLGYVLDRKLTKEKRKICLLVDICTAHHVSTKLSAIKLEFLPANTTVILQPLLRALFKDLKLLSKTIIEKIIAFIDEKISSAIEILDKISLADVLFMIKSAWDSIVPDSIRNDSKE